MVTLTGLPVRWLTPPKPSATKTELTSNNSVHQAKLHSMPLMASSFRCGEDREARQRHARTWKGSRGGSSEDGAEELLLPEGVLGGGDRHDEGVLTCVGVTVRHEVCSCFGDLGS